MRAWWIAGTFVACAHAAAPSDPASTPTASSGSPRAQAPDRMGSETAQRRYVVTETTVELLDPIQFLPASSSLDPRSSATLDAIASTLNGNPSIELVEVQAFAPDALVQFRARIAAERAQLIVDQLVARGVARARLTPAGSANAPAGRGEPLFLVVRRKG